MTHISTTEFRRDIGEIINRVAYGHERILLQRRGKDVVAVIPVEDLEYLQQLEDEYDLREALKARAEAEREGTIPWEDIKKRHDL